MLADTIQAELVRLQMHPVNLGVSAERDRHVALHGSLLRYWKLPPIIDAAWLLGVLRGLPDAAGPTVVMNAFFAAHVSQAPSTPPGDSATAPPQLDPATSDQAVRGGRNGQK